MVKMLQDTPLRSCMCTTPEEASLNAQHVTATNTQCNASQHLEHPTNHRKRCVASLLRTRRQLHFLLL